MNNYMTLKFKSIPENEMLARVCAAAFITPLNPAMSDLSDIKTSVSEAVTDAVFLSAFVMICERRNLT